MYSLTVAHVHHVLVPCVRELLQIVVPQLLEHQIVQIFSLISPIVAGVVKHARLVKHVVMAIVYLLVQIPTVHHVGIHVHSDPFRVPRQLTVHTEVRVQLDYVLWCHLHVAGHVLMYTMTKTIVGNVGRRVHPDKNAVDFHVRS